MEFIIVIVSILIVRYLYSLAVMAKDNWNRQAVKEFMILISILLFVGLIIVGVIVGIVALGPLWFIALLLLLIAIA